MNEDTSATETVDLLHQAIAIFLSDLESQLATGQPIPRLDQLFERGVSRVLESQEPRLTPTQSRLAQELLHRLLDHYRQYKSLRNSS